ncbi:WAS/WASL-interacting family protein [Perilla frutescens var. frutescens]|nr:WAS/WASL-interacting family protein [Perilla frutescens var. frutescens]
MFAQGGRKERAKERAAAPASPPAAVTAPVEEEPIIIPPVPRPVPVRQPIPEDQQREIFKWILEEKRKVKPQNRQEKKRVDEEKAILKEFIRSESLPRI